VAAQFESFAERLSRPLIEGLLQITPRLSIQPDYRRRSFRRSSEIRVWETPRPSPRSASLRITMAGCASTNRRATQYGWVRAGRRMETATCSLVSEAREI